MNKEKALEKVSFVKSKRTEDYIQEVLTRVEDYINSQETFSYQETMKFIQEQMSSKLGGIYIYINKALDFLNNELKAEYKNSKNRNL
jgi:hypothetical protein